jgi:cystathionine gamma-synthase
VHGDVTGSVIPPLFPSTTYARDVAAGGYDLRHLQGAARVPDAYLVLPEGGGPDGASSPPPEIPSDGEPHRRRPLMYARADNPSYHQAESVLAALDGGQDCALFSSGMAAVAAVASAVVTRGTRCVVPSRCYFAVRVFFAAHCEKVGATIALYDVEKGVGELEAALRGERDERRRRGGGEGGEGKDEGSSGDDVSARFRTSLVWVETPANPTWHVADVAAITAATARTFEGEDTTRRRRHHPKKKTPPEDHNTPSKTGPPPPRPVVCVDATALTPLLCRPLALGADLAMHSATKYLNGHSDVLAGALIAKDRSAAHWAAVKSARVLNGAVLGAFEAWLLLRGLRTLHARVERQSDSAMRLAEALEAHPAVLEVLYPGLPSHPGHAIARRQQSAAAYDPDAAERDGEEGGSEGEGEDGEGGEGCEGSEGGAPPSNRRRRRRMSDDDGAETTKARRSARMYGGMLSIRVRGGREAALRALSRAKVWVPATSLGGVESLAEHRRSVEGAGSGCPEDLLRLSVGLEDWRDLRDDLFEALGGGGVRS